MTTDKKYRFIVDVVFWGIILAIAYACFKYVLGWFLPFLLAFILSTLLQEPINFIIKHANVKRKIVESIITFSTILIIVGLFIWLLARFAAGINVVLSIFSSWISENFPLARDSINEGFERLMVAVPVDIESVMRKLITELAANLQSWLFALSSQLLGWTASQATKVPSFFLTFSITLVSTFFITNDYARITSFVGRQIPERHLSAAKGVWRTFASTTLKMLQSYLLIMAITFMELAVGFWLLDVNHNIALAMAIALFDILPALGVGAVLIPWGLAAAIGGNTAFGVGLLVLYLIIYIARNVIEPNLVGNRIGLPPFTMLLSMYFGVRLMGILGILLFPLFLILAKEAKNEGIFHLWN
ncbi:MAG: sporulation integral membrane protein YtvI [Eubacteriaceae bacterium]|nr:sporulation integral membrane protein YtvI [Eubacteriaceae bacterium]